MIKGKISSEANLQKFCVSWFKLKYENKGLGLIVSIPNEGRRNAKTGGRLKKMGLCAGATDLFIIKKGCPRTLFIEMKTLHHLSQLSDDQIEFHKKLRELGQISYVCRTLDQFMELVDGWFARPN